MEKDKKQEYTIIYYQELPSKISEFIHRDIDGKKF